MGGGGWWWCSKLEKSMKENEFLLQFLFKRILVDLPTFFILINNNFFLFLSVSQIIYVYIS